MNFNKITLLPLILTCLSTLSIATVYENAEEGHTENWIIHDNTPKGASIENLFDKELNSNVIQLQGEGRRNAYLIGSKKTSLGWNNKEEKILKWKMKFSEKFKISVYVQTNKGLRIFYYTHKNRNKGLYKKRYIRIGLGEKSMSNSWQDISRDLEADLKKYEPDNSILSVNGMKIQGSGKIDEISLVKKESTAPCLTRTELNNKLENGEDVTKVNTSCIKDMSNLSYYMPKEFHQDLSNWDVSNVTNMANMFANGKDQGPDMRGIVILSVGNLSHWDVSKVTNMQGMFAGFSDGMSSLQISNWDTSNVTNMENMFLTPWDPKKLDLVDISKWNVQNVSNHANFFSRTVTNKQPKWRDIKGDSELISLAKEHCLGTKNNSESVLCSNEKNIVYIIKNNNLGYSKKHYLYKINIDKNNENVSLIYEDHIGTMDTYFRKPLENTPIFEIAYRSVPAEYSWDYKLFTPSGKIIFQYTKSEQPEYEYATYSTINNGKKLIIDLFYWSYNEEKKVEESKQIRKLIYDISNPNEPKVISDVKDKAF